MQAWNVSVLTEPTSDTEPTLLVDFGVAKYVFNAGDGAGRAWLGSHHSFRKTRAIFATAAGTQRCGGVSGLLMLCADSAIPKLEIFGPYGLMHYLATMRGYTYRTTMAVQAIEAPSAPVTLSQTDASPPSPLFQDENITVYAIPLYPSDTPSSDELELMDTPSAPAGDSRPLKRKRSAEVLSAPPRQKSPPVPETTTALASTSPVSGTVFTRALLPGFQPKGLRGMEAQEWRKLMLQEMFPMPMPAPSAPVPSTGSKVKGKGRDNTRDEERAQEKARIAQVHAKKTHAAAEDPDADIGSALAGKVRSAVGTGVRLSRLPPLLEGHDGDGASDVHALPTLAYLVVGPSVRGKFDAERAKELGVPIGPIRGKLTRGESITFEVDDGKGNKVQRTVRPEECVAATEPPQSVLILDVPSPAYIPSLVTSFTESPFFAKYRSRKESERKEHPIHAVFHLCGEGVLEDPRYKTFMNGFFDETHHVIASRQHTPDKIAFGRSAIVQAKLNQLDADMFPLPKFQLEPARDLATVEVLPPKAILSRRNQVVHVRPLRPPEIDDRANPDEFDSFATSGALQELSESIRQKFAEVNGTIKERVGRRSPSVKPGDDILVTPLGTGSAVPTRSRNVSGTLIQIPGRGAILLDCGEGTWGQLARSFGNDPARQEGVWALLRDLKCIFLSHMHGDHHMGVSKILQMRALMRPPPSEPLYVVGLRQHLIYLTERHELEDLGLGSEESNGVVLILSDALNWRPPRLYGPTQPQDEPFMDAYTSQQKARAMCRTLGLESFTTVDVMHRVRCYGCVLRHVNNWSIVFSADTMPSENLVRVGQGATLLIHESSMSPEEENLAREKAHSTSAQAIVVGRRMKAQKLLLTHFSARYPGMPPREGRGSPGGHVGGPIVGIAFDYARIRLGDMWKLNTYLPVIHEMFNEFGEEDPLEIDLTHMQ
ncbi:hypothetical protein C2E23DRAFT_826150 [Lenzites betulinus]|nr:hypothetical protein C2E23DRAFT_826150 [Lenzites betulinus]